MKPFFLAVLLAAFANVALADMVEFHIKPATGKNAWNTPAEMLSIKVGDTLRIFNDDSIVHQLHTNGSPCDHGDPIAPGKSWDCDATESYKASINGKIYDHLVGPSAPFYLEVSDF